MPSQEHKVIISLDWEFWIFLLVMLPLMLGGCVDRLENQLMHHELRQLRTAVETYHSGEGE